MTAVACFRWSTRPQVEQRISLALRPGAPDRRRLTRGTREGGPKRGEAVSRILASYAEMPGLCLQSDEAAACLTCGPRRVASCWSTSWNQVNFGGTTRADTFVADQSLSLSNERGTYAD